MGMDEARSEAKKQATKWLAEEKKLEAQSIAARAKLKMMTTGDKVVGTATTQVEAAVDHIQAAREFSAIQVAQAQDDLERIETELTNVSAKLDAERAAKSAGDAVADTKQSLTNAVGGIMNKMKVTGEG